MKTKVKILVVLAIILGAICIFTPNKVEAKDAPIMSGTVTQEALNNIPNTISVNLKESEFEKVPALIMEQVMTELEKQGVVIGETYSQNSIGSVNVDFEKEKTYTPISDVAWTMNNWNIHSMNIKVMIYPTSNSNQIEVTKKIAIEYSNTKNYTEANKSYVANLVKSVDGATIDVYSSPNVPDTAIGIDTVIDTLSKRLNDASIKLIANGGSGDLEKEIIDYAVFKNDVYYQTITATANIYFVKEEVKVGDNIIVNGLIDGTNIEVTNKENKEMVTEINKKGYSKIIGSYELKLTGATSLAKPIDVTFDVGKEYNGQMAYVLHKKANGQYERFEKKIQNGKVTITVSELSPFVIAVKEQVKEEKPVNKGEKDETPPTGTIDIISYILGITLLAGIGIVATKKSLK